ncbi:cell division control protein 48 homolog A-like [Lotus japonicus]|uniref:cell division control protein 48 homolog A-like n=1 Tax=Lotus japonicus TaxID=34305 RepID=UPI002582BAD3|nr:cell division control protein 48 homolog A-like [Lotus japonicus]
MAQIRELVELPMRLPNLHKLPKGILLHGPPGSGKKMIATAVAVETGAFFFRIAWDDIRFNLTRKSEINLFEEAEKNAPSIIFIHEFYNSYTQENIVSELLTLLNGLKSRDRILVIGAAHCPDTVHPKLRTGIFDREIGIDALDEAG